jgi:phosphoribosylglycinamide formyltransferase-1
MSDKHKRLRLVVLISGRGSNLQAIIEEALHGDLPVDLRAVISNRPDAFGLERAWREGIPAIILNQRAFADRAAFEVALRERIDLEQPDLVVLAGFMLILSAGFVEHYRGRLLNIHPSLLPRYKGLHTHERVLAAGDQRHGASVHFVTPELDSGPVIVQAEVPVMSDDDVETLAARVLQREHRIYPLAIRWFAEGRMTLVDDRILFDSRPLYEPWLVEPEEE